MDREGSEEQEAGDPASRQGPSERVSTDQLETQAVPPSVTELTLKLKRLDASELVVQVIPREAPGPSGYRIYRLTTPSIEIDNRVLLSKASLITFLTGLASSGVSEMSVTCLRPRLARLRELLGAAPNSTAIPVDLKASG